jgi:hypothetical protein
MDHAPAGVLKALARLCTPWQVQPHTTERWINCACAGFASLLDAFFYQIKPVGSAFQLPQAFFFPSSCSTDVGGTLDWRV